MQPVPTLLSPVPFFVLPRIICATIRSTMLCMTAKTQNGILVQKTQGGNRMTKTTNNLNTSTLHYMFYKKGDQLPDGFPRNGTKKINLVVIEIKEAVDDLCEIITIWMNKVLRVNNRGYPYNQKYSSYGQLFGCLNHGNLNGRLTSTINNFDGITISELRAMIAYKSDRNVIAHQRKWSTAEQAQNYKDATQILLLANSYLPLPIDNELHIAFTKYLNRHLLGRELGYRTLIDNLKEQNLKFEEKHSMFLDKKYGPVADSNEVMRCKYILSILHTAISLLKDLLILPQVMVTGAESSGRKKRKADEAFDYNNFILHNTEGIFCTSKTEYRISLTEDALNDQTEREEDFRGYSRLAKG
ncbi:10489_t:CDS:2 [Funneliformis mosseae]|uniref:10489_t:CDS:1 n=1 Tax=Funneliformis mosseae TaxID=27381 RepID=A0A9N9FD86_FUNMO|nr:10489_t:CDS:2 [Funneliformis mosseae]